MTTVFTESQIRSYGVSMDSLTACKIVYRVGRTRAYQMLRDGEVDFPVLGSRGKYSTPTAAVLNLLGLDGSA